MSESAQRRSEKTYSEATPSQIYFDDIRVGLELPRLVKGPMTPLHVMRWSAAMENWHRIHYDQPFARNVDGLPDVLVNGSWKQQVFCQLLKDWAGRGGWFWRIRFQFRDMDPVGNIIYADAKVTETAEHDGLGYALCSVQLSNQNDKTTTLGEAITVLPLRGGRPVPYPFKPPATCPVTW